MLWLALCAASAGAQNPVDGDAPRLALSDTEWTFGEVPQGTALRKQMRIWNAGTAVLELTEFRSSCVCLPITRPKMRLAPGESDTFEVRYDTAHRPGTAAHHILIKCNDPAAAETTIAVRGEVRLLYALSHPEGAAFGRLPPDARRSIRVQFNNAQVDPVRLTMKPLPEQAPVSAVLREVQAGRIYELEVATRPPLAKGAWNGAVVIATSFESLPEIEIPCSLLVQDRVVLEPAVLMLPYSAASATSRAVKVVYLAERPLRLTAARCRTPEVTVVIDPAESVAKALPKADGDLFRFAQLRVTVPAGFALPEGGVDVEIETDDTEYPKLVLKLKGQAAPAAAKAKSKGAAAAGRGATSSPSTRATPTP